MDKSLVSWLMPVYNGEKFLKRAIDSMLNQTFQDFEIVIIIENGCTDKTEDICQNYATKDSRFKIVVNKTNLGIARSLNIGLDVCEGKYIARMDADDYSYPERLEKQISFMEANPDVGLLGTNSRIISDNSISEWYNPTEWYDSVPGCEEIWTHLLFETCFAHPTIMLRTKALKERNLKYPDCLAEDYALFAEMMISKIKMAILPSILLDYYISNTNLSFTNFAAVRPDSSRISRKALNTELQIDTSNYSDNHFGWRYYDKPTCEIKKLLTDSITLLAEIWQANKTLMKFDFGTIYRALEREWNKTKRMARPYGTLSCFSPSFNKLISKAIGDTFKALDLLSEPNRIRPIILYGTGKFLEDLLDVMDGSGAYQNLVFCDSNENKQGTFFYGKTIISPEKICDYNPDYVMISSLLYEKDIRNALLSKYNIEEDRIIGLSGLNPKVLAFHRNIKIYEKLYRQEDGIKKAYLFFAPNYGNLGDHAIAMASRWFFKEHFNLTLVEIPYSSFDSAIDIAKKNITINDLIVITGGGFLGSLWINLELQTRKVVSLFPNNPVLILPQTLYWDSSEESKNESTITRNIYASHNNLTLYARDTYTHMLMEETYPDCSVDIAPDMVLAVDWEGYFDSCLERNGALICLKNDKESVIFSTDKEYLCSLGEKLCETINISDNNLDVDIAPYQRYDLVRKKLNEFSGAKLVI
ncbi:MAG: glycosyltransferase, partial [Clostridiales bacterium]|nr:glycosyltransferase [Clostridiales bacterium]